MSKLLSQHTCGLLAACMLTLSCKGFSGVFTDDKPLAFVPGSTVNLPVAGGVFQSATVIDMNGDGVADGLDLDGNGVPEILYISLGADRAIGLDLNGDGIIDFYLVINFDGTSILQTARSGGSKVTVTKDAQGASGFDTDGDGSPNNTILTSIRNDVAAPTIGASPIGGTFTGPQSITLTCSDAVACNAIAYTTDGSAPNFSGGSSTVFAGQTVTVSLTITTTLRYIARDAKGNVSSIGNQTYTINAGASTYSIGGTISGLSGTVVLQNNAGNNLSVSANGSFAFGTTLTTGTSYAVTVLTQPNGQTCNVTNSSGTVASANVTAVSISCTNNNYTIGGTVTGLSGTVVLQNNAGNNLSLTTNGSFTFSTSIAHNATYSVTVLTQPAGQTCTVSSGSGTVNAVNVTNVTLSCTNNTYTIGGTVSGLTGTVVLQNNAGNNLSLTTNGSFTFSSAIAYNASYSVTVLTQPSGQTCTVSSASGTVSGANVTNVSLSCTNNSYTISGTITGLTGTLVLQNNGGDSLSLTANGGFSFATGLTSGSIYEVTVLTDPGGLVCSVGNNAGVVLATNISNVAVDCASDTAWVQDAYLKASNAGADDWFGYSVVISGNTIAVGARYEDSNQTTVNNTDGSASGNNSAVDAGAVYVFRRDTLGDWIQDAYLKPSNAEANDQFGSTVAISGNYIAVGAILEDSSETTITNIDGQASTDNSAPDSGAVYVFKREASGSWVQDAYFKASNTETNDYFGSSLAISGSTIVVGARYEDSNQTTISNIDGIASVNNATNDSGTVYVFKRDAVGEWTQDAYLKASNAGANDNFGQAVAISGSTIVVGAYSEDSNQTTITNNDGVASTNNSATDSGAVYVYKREASGDWIQDAYLKASNVGTTDLFGSSVAISGNTAVVGAYGEDANQTTISNADGVASADNSATNSGAVYVYKREVSGDWIQDAYLKASNAGAGDNFGYSVAISGSTLTVGAHLEDSSQTTITNADNSASANNTTSAGAVYVFKRTAAGNWVQDAYLKASNAEAEDRFGISVSISGGTLAVGAYREDASQTTITNNDGSASANNSATDAGAVYVFRPF